jgi:uncharacterized protein (TIGR02466 family)
VKSHFETWVEHKRLPFAARSRILLEQTIRKLPEVDRVGVRWSRKHYPGGYTSYGSLSDLHQQFSVFDELKRYLDREARTFARRVGMVFPRGELKLSSLWANLMTPGCYHAFHLHPNSIVSGTYYVSVPEGAGPLRIEDPRAGLFMACPPRRLQVDLQPRAGEVVLFESWMKHEVPPHRGMGERISVSFNYDWIQD